MNECMEITLCPDENYIMPCGVLIQSILYTNPETNIRFHIISDNLSDESKGMLHDVIKNTKGTVIFYSVNLAALSGLPLLNGSFATYIRLFISAILPAEIQKVLYLDGDTIAVNSLDPLWAVDITGYPAAGAVSHVSGDIRNYNRLGYDPAQNYYNAGVLLINLDYWRKNALLDKCLLFAEHNIDKLKFHDQDILNAVLAGQWKKIPLKFNCAQNCYMPIESFLIRKEFYNEIWDARMNPVIIHFLSDPKPWHKEYNMPLTEIWFFFKKMTSWKKIKLKYYFRGLRLLRYRIRKLLVFLRICKPDIWVSDSGLDMNLVIRKIYHQIKMSHNEFAE